MKLPAYLVLGVANIFCALAGCANLDVAAEGPVNRVLSGTVSSQMGFPAGSEVVVRVVDTSGRVPSRTHIALPLAERVPPPIAERVLGEHVQTLAAAASEAVPFQIEYQADDGLLRRGLTIEARVSYGGRVRFRSVNAKVVTLASSPYRHDVVVEQVAR